MNDNNQWDPIVIQNMLAYYRNKSYKLEYELLLYKETSEKRHAELSRTIESLLSRGNDETTTSKPRKRKSNEKHNK